MRITRNLTALAIIWVVLVFVLTPESVYARQVTSWVINEKVPGYLDDTFTPFLVADQNRTVHAFATQWIGEGSDRKRAVVYRQWTLDGGWTRPIDILLSPTWDAQVLGVFLAPDGVFHLIFWGSQTESVNSGIYYSTVLAAQADDSLAWSFPELIGEDALNPSAGAIIGDEQGNLVVVYSGNKEENGIYVVRSDNSGKSWSESIPIFLIDNPNLLPYYIKVYIGASERVHVVWNVNVSEDGTYDSLYYAGIDARTGDWTEPLLLDKRPDINGYFGPSIPAVVDNGKYVMIMYNGGNPFAGSTVPVGRPTILIRLSEDGGYTWGDVTAPFPFLTGQSGEHALLIDSNQVIHAIAEMRVDRLINGEYKPFGGVWYSEFDDGVWRYPQRFVTTISPVDIRAVISQGNVILATWCEDPIEGQDGVWSSYTMIDSLELPINPLPEPIVVEGNPANTTNNGAGNEDTPLATETPIEFWNNEDATVVSPQMPIIVGIIPAIILIAGIILRTIYTKRK